MARWRDDFNDDTLDRTLWLPHYLPAWSSLEETAATYEIEDSALRLWIPEGAPLWCRETHPEPLRVSGMASGNWSGPVGSTRGQQRFTEGLFVQEQQERFEGWLQPRGRLAVSCRMTLCHSTMAAVWLSGFEEDPHQAGELCVVEIFGKTVTDRSADVGVGVKQLYDPDLEQDFVTPTLPIDVSEFHEYAVEWDSDGATFTVDGDPVHRTASAPTYAMQIMLGVFDFPGWRRLEDDPIGELVIDWVAGDAEARRVR